MDINPFIIPHAVAEKVRDRAFLHNEMSQGKLGQEILGFSESVMGQFYVAALHIFEEKRYADAVDAFLFLSTLNPEHYDYWLGLGASLQHCNDYEGAVDAYEMAAICQIDCPVPYFHLSKCLFAMHDRASSLQAIDLALEYSEFRDEYADLHRQAKAAKELILKEQ